MVIAVTMCKLLAVLLLGYYLNKRGILEEGTSKRLSTLVVNYVLPFLIINSVADIEGDPGEVLLLFGAGILCYCLFPLIAWVLVRILRVPVTLRGTYMCMLIFSNNTFMGYPVVAALFGNQAIFYTTIFHMAYNLMFFSLGMILIRRDAQVDNYQKDRPLRPAEKWKVVRQVANNGVLASILALVIYFCRIPLPEVVTETCSFIGNICMPLSMLVIGSSIASYPLRELFTEKRVYFVTVFRLMLLPALTYLVVQLLIPDYEIVKIATITVGMPIGSLVAMGAAPFGEQGKAASIAVVFTTLCSMATIPVMCMLLGT